MSDQKVWFITGASTGFGRALAQELITRGDTVVATARNESTIEELGHSAPERVLTTRLDVTDQDSIAVAVAEAHKRFGRIDVLVNNAGYGLRGAVEEFSEAELRQQFDTNVFGVLWVTREVLPIMRAQRCGHIVQISSVAGVSTVPSGTAYAGSKFALEGLSQGLADEIAPFGIGMTIVEPGPFRTDFSGRSIRWAAPMKEYADYIGPARERFEKAHGTQPGDPVRAVKAIITAVESDEPPLRLPLGKAAFNRIRSVLTERLAELDRVEPLGAPTDYPT